MSARWTTAVLDPQITGGWPWPAARKASWLTTTARCSPRLAQAPGPRRIVRARHRPLRRPAGVPAGAAQRQRRAQLQLARLARVHARRRLRHLQSIGLRRADRYLGPRTPLCGSCGQAMTQIRWERAMYCQPCDLRSYPRISPSMIVLVTRGDEILLARSPRFVTGCTAPWRALLSRVSRPRTAWCAKCVKKWRWRCTTSSTSAASAGRSRIR